MLQKNLSEESNPNHLNSPLPIGVGDTCNYKTLDLVVRSLWLEKHVYVLTNEFD